jgi:hypothetical protein
MCRLYQDALRVAKEFAEKLAKEDWFIGIVVPPAKPYDFIICSREGNSALTVATVKLVLDEPFAGSNIVVGIYDDYNVRIFPVPGKDAELFYEMWLERTAKCSGKLGMPDMGLTN